MSTHVRQLAAFAGRAFLDQLSGLAQSQPKIRVLDARGCAIGALGGEPVRMLRARLRDGQVLEREKDGCEGFHTRPATWEQSTDESKRLAEPLIDEGLSRQIIALVQSLETAEVADLVSFLAEVPIPAPHRFWYSTLPKGRGLGVAPSVLNISSEYIH